MEALESWVYEATFSVLKDLRVITFIDYLKNFQYHDLGLYTSNLEHFGNTRLQKIALVCSQAWGLFPRRTQTFFTQSGVFSLGMGVAQKVIG